MDSDEAIPFKGLPPLPRVFRKPSSSPSPPPETGQEADEGPARRSCSLRDRIIWLHAEMRRVRRADLVLFQRLHTLALEIQDLKELQQEMESLSKEEPFAEGGGQVGGDAGPPAHVGTTAAFELTI
uniref:Uncharacterized protein n=1 Tax=Sphaerodactylus townsendi TaxID=933632 RepID=A0ACB8FS49_9SAUR